MTKEGPKTRQIPSLQQMDLILGLCITFLCGSRKVELTALKCPSMPPQVRGSHCLMLLLFVCLFKGWWLAVPESPHKGVAGLIDRQK